MNDQIKRYELFGWDYPIQAPLSDEEVAWYLRFARETGGPVLDIPCGTGRLLCRLAEAGFEITGIDLSGEMLAIARRNVAELSPEAQSRVRLIRRDMANFSLSKDFGLIYIADNSFRELTDRASQLACLRRVREHLREDGVFLMTERRFDPTLYPNGRREFDYGEPFTNPETGDSVRRRLEADLSPDGKRISGALTYEVTHPDGSATIERCPNEAPILMMDDYLALFAEADLTATAYADYTQAPADGTERLTCFVCRRAGEERNGPLC